MRRDVLLKSCTGFRISKLSAVGRRCADWRLLGTMSAPEVIASAIDSNGDVRPARYARARQDQGIAAVTVGLRTRRQW